MQFTKLFKVSAADEVAEMYTLNRTYIVTLSTACALAVIDGGKVVFYLDGTLGTVLLTLHAADTAVRTNLTYLCALVVAGALNNNAGGIVDKVDDVVGTGLCTKAATDTLLGIDLCNASVVVNGDSIAGTNLDTVAVAKAGKGTVTVTGIVHIRSNTGLNTVVNILSLLGLTSAVTSNVGYLRGNVACCKTQTD